MNVSAALDIVTCRVCEPPLELYWTEAAFRPNPTTVRFARAVRVSPGDVVFDIGTGIGPLAIKAGLDGAGHVHGVDPVPLHCELARRNIAKYGLSDRITIHEGWFFDPFTSDPALRGLKANVVIGDVSGIAEPIAHALGWYSTRVPTGGEDGATQLCSFLDRAAGFMAPGGTLYFPVALDLSDADRILAVANQRFSSVTNAFDRPCFEFPLSDVEVGAIENAYASRGGLPSFIRIQKGRRAMWRGQILAAHGPR